MAIRLQGTVTMLVVVLADGTVGDVTVTKSLDTRYGLDTQAIAAVKEWRFRPGTRNGEPVAVQVMVEMEFNLRGGPERK
jgi:protein TonB